MSSLLHPTVHDVQLALQTYGDLTVDGLVSTLFPATEEIFLAGGYSGENPWDAIVRWYRETVVPTCKRAGDQGMHVLTIINDPKSAADLALIKIVSDFLIDYTSVASATEVKFAIGISLLIIHCARIEKEAELGPPS